MTHSECGRWRWVTIEVELAIHEPQIAEHGAAEGIRDLGSIDSALDRPANLWAHARPDPPDLAASYAYGLVSSHGFADGKKRTAWVAARWFLTDTGYRLKFDPFDAIRAVAGLASNQISEVDLSEWFRICLVR